MIQRNKTISRCPWALRFGLVTTSIVLAAGLVWYGLPSTWTQPTDAKPAARPLATTTSSPPTNAPKLAVAQRQRRCRALNHHLGLLAKSTNRTEAEGALRNLSVLTGEMLNAYPMQGTDAPDSRALALIYTHEGRRDLHEAREDLRDTLRAVHGVNGAQAAARVQESCRACHARFTRDGGAGLRLSAASRGAK